MNRSSISNPPTSFPTEGVPRAIEEIISAWAFAHNIDGAARNDLFARLRASPQLQSTEAVGRYREALVEIEHAEHVEIARRIARTVLSKQDKDENSG